MHHTLIRAESSLLAAVLLAVALAISGPHISQYANYHAFADQRALAGLPFAMDVLSNLPFALFGAWGLWCLRPTRLGLPQGVQKQLAVLFFAGLIITALCSSWYHLQPSDARLAADRLGMVLPFAGLLGLAVADHISPRAGAWTAAAVVGLGPWAVGIWAASGNLLPWSVLQGGGMLLMLVLAMRKPLAGTWGLPLGAVIGWYVLAKLLELGDHPVFAITQGYLSGHTLKHIAAAMAAWPVIALMHNGSRTQQRTRGATHARASTQPCEETL